MKTTLIFHAIAKNLTFLTIFETINSQYWSHKFENLLRSSGYDQQYNEHGEKIFEINHAVIKISNEIVTNIQTDNEIFRDLFELMKIYSNIPSSFSFLKTWSCFFYLSASWESDDQLSLSTKWQLHLG